jgi:hypothetical protein
MHILSFILLGVVQGALKDSIKATSDPDPLYISGTNTLWPTIDTRQQIHPLSKGDKQLVYFRFLKREGSLDSSRTYTAVFYPKVDDFTLLTIPNSYSLLNTLASSQNYADASLILYYSGRYLEVPYRKISINRLGQTYYVPGRTILIELNKGIIQSIGWAFTQCAFTECMCIEGLCGQLCPSKECDATLRIAWTGTDASGIVLTSYGILYLCRTRFISNSELYIIIGLEFRNIYKLCCIYWNNNSR